MLWFSVVPDNAVRKVFHEKYKTVVTDRAPTPVNRSIVVERPVPSLNTPSKQGASVTGLCE